MIAALDELQNQVDAAEASLRDLNKRMLAAAEAHYGPDSNQYEQAAALASATANAQPRKRRQNPRAKSLLKSMPPVLAGGPA